MQAQDLKDKMSVAGSNDILHAQDLKDKISAADSPDSMHLQDLKGKMQVQDLPLADNESCMLPQDENGEDKNLGISDSHIKSAVFKKELEVQSGSSDPSNKTLGGMASKMSTAKQLAWELQLLLGPLSWLE